MVCVAKHLNTEAKSCLKSNLRNDISKALCMLTIGTVTVVASTIGKLW